MEDIRWEQRFSNYLKALEKLKQSIDYMLHDFEATKDVVPKAEDEVVLNEMLKEGLIQRFEYTHELAWNVMKDYAEYQGNSNIGGSRDASREAFQLQLISNGHVWMDMISSRNKTSHTYNEATANAIYEKIVNEYYPAFLAFENIMKTKIATNQ
jgi:nucleotidyltransferase substrate binding protein (TIGR01987 family)|nr:nucleotidyltransferase substrate binding protein [uncultured Flavobacterium sp.]